MKVSKEVQFTLTEEEICAIVLKHMKDDGQLPEMEFPFEKTRTSIMYSQPNDVYKFEVIMEKGTVDE